MRITADTNVLVRALTGDDVGQSPIATAELAAADLVALPLVVLCELVWVTYNVNTSAPAGRRRLRRVARACLDWGQRVQYSVFECEFEPAQWVLLRAHLLSEIDPATDSLRFYRLGADGICRIEHVGAKPTLDLDGPWCSDASANLERPRVRPTVRAGVSCWTVGVFWERLRRVGVVVQGKGRVRAGLVLSSL